MVPKEHNFGPNQPLRKQSFLELLETIFIINYKTIVKFVQYYMAKLMVNSHSIYIFDTDLSTSIVFSDAVVLAEFSVRVKIWYELYIALYLSYRNASWKTHYMRIKIIWGAVSILRKCIFQSCNGLCIEYHCSNGLESSN